MVCAPALVIEAHVKLGIHLVAAADHAQVGVAVEHQAHLQSTVSVHPNQRKIRQASHASFQGPQARAPMLLRRPVPAIWDGLVQ